MALKFGIGVAIVAVLIAALFYKQRGDHLEPTGTILKLRSIPIDDQRSLVVLDLRIQNDSDIAMVVRDLSLTADTKDGQEIKCTIVSAHDTKQLFHYYPALGESYNEPLTSDSRIGPRKTADFMLAARLDIPEPQLVDRRNLAVLVQDRSMSKLTLLEKQR